MDENPAALGFKRYLMSPFCSLAPTGMCKRGHLILRILMHVNVIIIIIIIIIIYLLSKHIKQ